MERRYDHSSEGERRRKRQKRDLASTIEGIRRELQDSGNVLPIIDVDACYNPSDPASAAKFNQNLEELWGVIAGFSLKPVRDIQNLERDIDRFEREMQRLREEQEQTRADHREEIERLQRQLETAQGQLGDQTKRGWMDLLCEGLATARAAFDSINPGAMIGRGLREITSLGRRF